MNTRYSCITLLVGGNHEVKLDVVAVDYDLSRIGKIHSDAAADIRLNLTNTPIRAVGMPDKRTGFKERVDIGHSYSSFAKARMTEMIDENALNDLIGSRICHDLISPLGAIGNGVELLSLSGSGAEREIALISESIENAHARIKYFRVAFGASTDTAIIGEAELRAILRDMYRGGRLSVHWQIDRDLPRTEVKLAFLLIQCLETALPWGGNIIVARSSDGQWSITAKGKRIKVAPQLWEIISDPQSDTQVTASEVQFALVRALASRMDRQLRVSSDETGISISF